MVLMYRKSSVGSMAQREDRLRHRLMLAATLILAAGALFTVGRAFAQAGVANELEALIKAAKAEGEVSLYSAATENVPKRVGAAFTAKYGIKFNSNRISSAPLMQRYSAESEAGNVAADIAWIAGGVLPFTENALKRGWIEPVAQAGLPVVKSGEFPMAFIRPNSAVAQVAPWGITYHTDRLKGADIPKDIKDILAPRFKGQILLPDPRSSDVYLAFWGLVLDRFGEQFFTQLRALEPRRFASGVPAVQALGAGEGLVELPAVPAQVLATKSTGAPVDISIPSLTTGLEMEVVLTARARAKHPNAARLLANYVMSREGNKVFNDDPGGVTIYDTSGLPKQYEAPKEGTGAQATGARREQLTKLLGF